MTLDIKIETRKKAYKAAVELCKRNNLSIDKLNKQSFYFFGDMACFAQEVEGTEKGLLEDIATQPKDTLIYDVKNDTLSPTEFTDQYLK